MVLSQKQKKNISRSKAIFLIKGNIATLNFCKNRLFRSYVLKGMINSAIISLEHLLTHMQSSRYSNEGNYLNDFYQFDQFRLK